MLPAVIVDGGDANITYGGNISSGRSNSITVQNRSGGQVTFGGTLNLNAPQAPILIQNNSGGGTTFSGPAKSVIATASSSSVGAIELASNTGHVVRFDNGSLTTQAVGGVAFQARGGGTVSVSGGGNTLSSTVGPALNVVDTTIGVPGLTFRSISAGSASAGPTSGIVLSNTGETPDSPSPAQARSAVAGRFATRRKRGFRSPIPLTSRLTRMAIVAPRGSGVRGTGVVNFGFLQGSIDQSTAGSAIAFDKNTDGTENNVSGVVAINSSQFTNALESGIRIRNFAGTLDSVQISGNTLTSAATQSASTGSGIELIASGSDTTGASVMRATIDGNTIRNFPSGHGIHLQGGNPTLGGPGGTFGVPNNTASDSHGLEQPRVGTEPDEPNRLWKRFWPT